MPRIKRRESARFIGATAPKESKVTMYDTAVISAKIVVLNTIRYSAKKRFIKAEAYGLGSL